MESNLNRAILRAAMAVQPVTIRWPATLSTASGDITPSLSAAVSGENGFVWAVMPTGGVVKAYNSTVTPTTGERVWVGYEPHNPTLLRVLDFNSSYAIPSISSGHGPHHQTHEWLNPDGGGDVVYSQARQLMPLRVKSISAFIVGIEPSPEAVTGGWAISTTATLNLAADVPTIGSRYALIYLTAAGTLARRLGTAVGPFATLPYTSIPARQAGEIALAAIALYAGHTALHDTQGDIVDLRFASFTAGGALVGSGTIGRVAQWATASSLGDSPLTVDTLMHVKPAGAVSTNVLGFDGTDWIPVAGGGGGGGGGGPAEFAQQEYATANITLGLTPDGGWVDVDATNAVITATPSSPGTYYLTFNFAIELGIDTTAHSGADNYAILFRLYDGTTGLSATRVVSDGTIPDGRASAVATLPVDVSGLFTWPATLQTVRLQRWIQASGTAISSAVILAGSGPVVHMDLYRLGGGTVSPLTTKGDIWGYSTVDARVPVGADGKILSADSTKATGVDWITPPASSPLTTKGDLLTHSTLDVRLPVGADGQVLTADSAVADGVAWATPVSSGGGGAGPVAARYNTAAAQAVNNGTIINFDTLVYDTNAAVTTGAAWKFTAPEDGYYDIEAMLTWNIFAAGATVFQIILFVNAAPLVEIARDDPGTSGGISVYHNSHGAATLHLAAGDELQLYGYQNSGSAKNLLADGSLNWVSITRATGHPVGTAIPDFLQAAYTAAVILLGTSTDVAFVDADAVNAAITFTPQAAGKYKVTFIFGHYTESASTDILFRLTDGTTNSPAWEIFGALATASQEKIVTLSYVFNWTAAAHTVKLQKRVITAASVTANEIESGGGPALYMLVERLSGIEPLATARANTSAGQALLDNTVTIIDFGTVDFDSASAITTGAAWHYTAPVTGIYSVRAAILITLAGSVAHYSDMQLWLNGSLYSYLQTHNTAAASQDFLKGEDLISLSAGDTVDVRVVQNGAALTAHLYAGGILNYINIVQAS